MRHARLIALLLGSAALTPVAAQDTAAPPAEVPTVPVPAALTAEEMPPIPLDMADRARPYLEARGAGFAGWDPNTRAVLISTRFANTNQLHRVDVPMGARTQISFEAEPVRGSYAPTKGDVILVTKDRGGDEYYQLHTPEGRTPHPADRWKKPQPAGRVEQGRRTGRLQLDQAQRGGFRPLCDEPARSRLGPASA